jgi:alpha/beta superfamily hydrolase
MTSLVTSELFRLLPQRGIAVLRFNFRGVGKSGGEHGGGRDESLDITAAIDSLASLSPERPLVLCGWSFGADVALSMTDERLDAWVGIAPPLRILPREEIAAAAGADPRPKLLIIPEHDQFLVPEAALEATGGWVNTRIETIKGGDHFLVGRTDKAARLVAGFLSGLG